MMKLQGESFIEIADESFMIMDSPNFKTAQFLIKWCKGDMFYSCTGKDGPWQSVTDTINKALAESIRMVE